MKLSILFIVLTLFSIPAIASKDKELNSRHAYADSFFKQASGSSVLKSNFLVDSFSQYSSKHNAKNENWYSSSLKYENTFLRHLSSVNHDSKFSYLEKNKYSDYFNENELPFSWHRKGNEFGWKNEHICAPIPEPENYALIALGLLMVTLVARKKN